MRRLHFDRLSGIYLWIVFIVVFGIWAPHTFLTVDTMRSVASTQATTGLLALSVLVPLVAGQFDLSIGANANMTAILAVILLNDGMPLPLTLLISVCAGVVVGAVNGFIVVGLGVSSFIATLGTGTILGAVQVIISQNELPGFPESSAWSQLAQHSVGGFQVIVFYLLVVALLVWWFLDFTPAGRYLYSIGGNPEAARLAGVKVRNWTWISLLVSGGLSGLAGVLYAAQSGPSLTFGPSLLLPAFAAAFLGATQIQPGRFNVWGTVLAIYVLATGVQGIEFVANEQWISSMFNGVALLVAVSLAVTRSGRRTWRLRRSSRPGWTIVGGADRHHPPVEADPEATVDQ
jgi:ribose transport system permease protein